MPDSSPAIPLIGPRDQALIASLRDGLPLVPEPYAALGLRIGMAETEVLTRLHRLIDSGVIRRFGAIVRHHEVGFRANAMTVFDIPDAEVSAIGQRLATEAAITLCYRRERAPGWPYSLYCMIHGRDRAVVLAQVDDIRARHALHPYPHAVLFSLKRFKQTAGAYA